MALLCSNLIYDFDPPCQCFKPLFLMNFSCSLLNSVNMVVATEPPTLSLMTWLASEATLVTIVERLKSIRVTELFQKEIFYSWINLSPKTLRKTDSDLDGPLE